MRPAASPFSSPRRLRRPMMTGSTAEPRVDLRQQRLSQGQSADHEHRLYRLPLGFTTSGSQKCWDCHAPGSAPPSACADTCHLFQANGEHPSYPTAFTHGVTPHLGASGYGKTCADCHGAGNAHHDAAAASAPACADVPQRHVRRAPVGHEGRSSDCARRATRHEPPVRPTAPPATSAIRARAGRRSPTRTRRPAATPAATARSRTTWARRSAPRPAPPATRSTTSRWAPAPSATPTPRASTTAPPGHTPRRLRQLPQRFDRGAAPEPCQLRHPVPPATRG